MSKTATIDREETLYNNVTSLPLDGTFNVNWFGKLWLYAYSWDGYNFTIDITHNWTTKSYTAVKQNTFAEFWDNIAIYNWDTYKISSTYSFSDGRITLYFKYWPLPGKPIKFYSVKPIWEKLTCYLFGMLPTGEWWDWN